MTRALRYAILIIDRVVYNDAEGVIKLKEKSFERKTELLEAALDEFTSKSYEDASLNMIIKNAGISKGLFIIILPTSRRFICFCFSLR